MPPDPSVLVLLSGGADSTLCSIRASKAGDLRALLFVDYGQPAAVQERAAARRVARTLAMPLTELRVSGDSAQAMDLGPCEPGPRVVPGRNLFLAALGLSEAIRVGAKSIHLGCNWDDAANYPDCREQFMRLLNSLATSTYDMRVHAPLLTSTKREILAELAQEGMLDATWSCYQPAGLAPCGGCDACRLRLESTR